MAPKSTCGSLTPRTALPSSSSPSLSPAAFIAWLNDRLAAGYSRAALGRELGVSTEAIRLYLAGMNPSRTVLLLAERIRIGS